MYLFKAEYVMKQIENGDTNMFAKKGFAIVALATIVYAVPISAYAQMSGSVVGIDRENIRSCR
ncbi:MULTISPECIES: hypothetical protein [Gardnerella]|jgi:hypothetical protein|uniref:Uncharacterized protein n=4 Tax=Gardnerella vaginalis TaxID=2702 RepID=A0ABD4ZA63_GARVA|nr:hypothetical protein [Gardnerella vaginalis]EPI49121.1 hypothetical protein HMPREF1581_00328 [Gardnerella vaginalis JCP8108]CRH62882.1 Uncharacterised protein [Chlamydia trachomatis]AYZ21207.1 hypothetical protein EGX90_01160 [Gardnerella vaginalis]MBE0296113.1 hypothetical protein [Gardnerella vaginalis]MDK6695647.1 hypothetical protein [Gardnerella vaginalis]